MGTLTPEEGKGQSDLDLLAKRVLHLRVHSTPSHLFLPTVHLSALASWLLSPMALQQVSLIYFCLDFHALHTDYHLGDSTFAYFLCLICITTVLQPTWTLFGLWECQAEGIGAFVMVSAEDRGYVSSLFPTAPHAPDAPFHSGTGRALPLPRQHVSGAWISH